MQGPLISNCMKLMTPADDHFSCTYTHLPNPWSRTPIGLGLGVFLVLWGWTSPALKPFKCSLNQSEKLNIYMANDGTVQILPLKKSCP